MDLLRFTTAGSVDDGKSTLIGRLLYDSKSIFEDQLEAIEESSRKRGDEHVNLALLTDGLRAEREQGITIDVAYRFFTTDKRKFIVADTPGHQQYTRNMATGASTASLAILMIDARKGILEQTKRHAFIASLLGIKQVILAVNKLDLMDYSKKAFDEIVSKFDMLQKDFGLKVSRDKPWFEALKNIPITKSIYIRAVLRRGENIKRQPRIKLSTIHGSKGGEADNVMLLTDLTRKADEEYWRQRDQERRVFYVGMTRARNTLNIVRSQSDREFSEVF